MIMPYTFSKMSMRTTQKIGICTPLQFRIAAIHTYSTLTYLPTINTYMGSQYVILYQSTYFNYTKKQQGEVYWRSLSIKGHKIASPYSLLDNILSLELLYNLGRFSGLS